MYNFILDILFSIIAKLVLLLFDIGYVFFTIEYSIISKINKFKIKKSNSGILRRELYSK